MNIQPGRKGSISRRQFLRTALLGGSIALVAAAVPAGVLAAPAIEARQVATGQAGGLAQDRGAILWLPWVALGLVAAIARGRSQLRAGEPPAAWAIAAQSLVALLVVTSFIPLAWDRYFLSIQPGSALLGAFAAVEGFDLIRRAIVGKPGSEPSP